MKSLRDALRSTIRAAAGGGSEVNVQSERNVVVSVNHGSERSTHSASAQQTVDIRQSGRQQQAADPPNTPAAGEGGGATA